MPCMQATLHCLLHFWQDIAKGSIAVVLHHKKTLQSGYKMDEDEDGDDEDEQCCDQMMMRMNSPVTKLNVCRAFQPWDLTGKPCGAY